MPRDPLNAYSHLAGALMSVVGLVALVVLSRGDPWRVAAFSIYGGSLVLLYAASSLYHWLGSSDHAMTRLRRFDHAAIFVLIAGTYTPICLISLGGRWGWSLFAVVWAMAIAGVGLKMFVEGLPRWSSTALYLGMGWIAVVAAVPLARSMPSGGLLWLVVGGLFYTFGAVIYGLKRPDPWPATLGFHGVFHFFVLAGSGAHFVCMACYVLPVT
ncbi:MAG: hemolysin III family protein [Deltaproteobacteria bacterium]